MIIPDEADISYRFFIILSGLIASVLSLISIIGYFLEEKPKCDANKYLYYSYLLVAVAILIDGLTYAVPSCMPYFCDKMNLCLVMASIQYVVENIIYCFIIGVSVFLFLSVSDSYKKCRCKERGDFSKPLFLSWSVAGSVYSVICLILSLYYGAIDLRSDGRCWFVQGIGKLTSFQVSLITHRLFMDISIFIAAFFALLTGIHVIHFKKVWKEYIEESSIVAPMNDGTSSVSNVMTLHKALLKKFSIFAAIVLMLVLLSRVVPILQKKYFKGAWSSVYFGWLDFVYLILFFLAGFIFYKKFTISAMNRLNVSFISYRNKRDGKKTFSRSLLVAKE